MTLKEFSNKKTKLITATIVAGGIIVSIITVNSIYIGAHKTIGNTAIVSSMDNVSQAVMSGDTFSLNRIAGSLVQMKNISEASIIITGYEPISAQLNNEPTPSFSFPWQVEVRNTPGATVLITVQMPLLPLFSRFFMIICFWLFVGIAIRYLISNLIKNIQKPLEDLNSFAENQVLQISGTPIEEVERIKSTIQKARKQAENANKRLLDTNREFTLGKITRNVRHDTNQALVAIGVALNKMDKTKPEVRLMSQAVERIESIISSIPKIDVTGEPEFLNTSPARPNNIVTVVKSACEEFQEMMKNKGSDTLVSLQQSEEILVCDINRMDLSRCLFNLMLNSYEARAKKIEIFISRSSNKAIIQINDNGVGFPQNILPKLGVEKITQGKPNGTGLGICYVNNCVKQWGGKIELSNSGNTGANILIELNLLKNLSKDQQLSISAD